LPSRPFVFIALVFFLAMALFTAARLLFYLSVDPSAGGSDPWSVGSAFLVGLRFDLAVVLVLLAPALLVLPWVRLKRKATAAAALTYLTVCLSVCVLLLLVDVRYYAYFASHLDFRAIEYFNQGRTFWHLVVSDPMFYPVLAGWLVGTALLACVLGRFLRFTRGLPDRRGWGPQVAFFVLLAVLAVLGIRGRVSTSPLRWGLAYVSDNHFVNQLGLNGVYTLARAYSEEGHDSRLSYAPESERFPFVDFREGLDSVRVMLDQPGDEWLEPDRSLLRKTTQPAPPYGFRPNVIVVLMESWSGRNTSALASPHRLTPNFDRLARQGLLFTRFYTSGIRTSYGMTATLCSFPSLPGRSVMTRYNADHPFIAFSEILHERGYVNCFAYGGDLVFDNMEGFLRTKKYDRFFGEDYFGRENVFAEWGVPDHIVFNRLVPLIDSLPRPFQLTILTLSNHEPFDLPDSSVRAFFDDTDSSKVFNAQLYADFALGQFMDSLRQRPLFDSTIFVFTADHAKWVPAPVTIHPVNFHIPLLIYSPGTLGSEERRIGRIGSQTDILPTIMGLLGSDYTHASWGRDLLRLPPEDSGFAMMNVLSLCGFVQDGLLYFEYFGRKQKLYELAEMPRRIVDVRCWYPTASRRMQRRMRYLVQIAEQLSTPAAEVRR